MLVNRMPAILTRGVDNALHKRPPVSQALSSKDVLSDMAFASHIKQKNRASLATSDGISFLLTICAVFCLLVLDNCDGDLKSKDFGGLQKEGTSL